MNMNHLLGKFHRYIGKYRSGMWLSIKLRNQVMAIIRAGLNDGIDMNNNGEKWLIDKVAPRASYFIDVGANVGDWTQAFISQNNNPQIHGLLFEPAPETRTVLCSKIASMITAGTIEVSSSAVSDKFGNMSFFTENNCGETSSLIKQHSLFDSLEISVNLTTIDHEIKLRGIKHIDMLKIDAEGYDLHVLKGASLSLENRLIDVIQFEYNLPWAYAGSTLYDALSFLSKLGYQVFILRKDGIHKFKYDLYGEYYGYSNFVALSKDKTALYC